jgi:hypothetical protein
LVQSIRKTPFFCTAHSLQHPGTHTVSLDTFFSRTTFPPLSRTTTTLTTTDMDPVWGGPRKSYVFPFPRPTCINQHFSLPVTCPKREIPHLC